MRVVIALGFLACVLVWWGALYDLDTVAVCGGVLGAVAVMFVSGPRRRHR